MYTDENEYYYELMPMCQNCPYNYNNLQYGTNTMFRQMPSGPPPSFTPEKPQATTKQIQGGPGGPAVMSIDQGAIRPCLYRFVYIWERNRRSYWAFITFVGRRSISGFRWNGFRWVYFGLDLRRIDSFICY
jgi:hypothetical protein